MKNLWIVVCFLLIAGNVFAHQPDAIEAKYDPKAKALQISIKHTTQNRKEHFIRRIVVLVNDRQVASRNFFFQASNTGMEAEIPLNVTPEDQISIQAYSERGGVLKQSFMADEITEKDEPSDNAATEHSAEREKSQKPKKPY